MRKLFMSSHCPDCPPVIEYLDDRGVEYEKVDITASMPNLKEYLALRDNREEYEFVKERGFVGIPALLEEDGEILFRSKIYERY